MLLNPIIERELRIALRIRRAARSRFHAAIYGAVVVAFILILQYFFGDPSIGKSLARWLFYGGLYLSVSPAFSISAGMFAEERKNQTLELLYLTGMNDAELFLGKLLGGFLVASNDLLALAPMFAVPFLCGGISFDLFLATIVCFPVLLMFVLAVGAFGSAMKTDEGSALVMSSIVAGIICFILPLPFFMGQALNGTPPFASHWLCFSPAYGPYLVWGYFGGGSVGAFWKATAISLVWTLLFLVLASVMLRRNWRNDLEKNRGRAELGLLDSLAGNVFTEKFALRNRVLSANPFQWLVERDRRTPMLALMIILGTVVLWLACWVLWRHVWFSAINLIVTATMLLISTSWLENFAAARRLGEDRRDGVLEILLTTPLSPVEIVDGQLAGMRAQFKSVRQILFGLFITMALGGFLDRTWTTGAVASYLMIWTVLLVTSLQHTVNTVPQTMWIALNTGRPHFIMAGNRGGKMSRFANLYNLFNFFTVFGVLGRLLSGFPSGSALEIALVIFGFFIWGCLMGTTVVKLSKYHAMQNKLINEMRSIAADPVPDPKDPHFKNWKVTERFYATQSYNFPEMPRPFPREARLR